MIVTLSKWSLKTRAAHMTVAPAEFIRRFILHVLPKGFHRIRHYGLLASSAAKANTIARARQLIAEAAPPQPPPPAKQHEATAGTEATDKPIHPCPWHRFLHL